MTNEADRVVDLLLLLAGSTEDCEEANMVYDAIDLIEELSAKVEELEQQMRDAAKGQLAIVQTAQADRDQWKQRAEQLQRDLDDCEAQRSAWMFAERTQRLRAAVAERQNYEGGDPEMIVREKIDYIRNKISPAEAMTGLAEEAAELAQAALKLRRAMTGVNPTPVTETEAWEKLREEFADVLTILRLVDILPRDTDILDRIQYKTDRWVERLRAAEA